MWPILISNFGLNSTLNSNFDLDSTLSLNFVQVQRGDATFYVLCFSNIKQRTLFDVQTSNNAIIGNNNNNNNSCTAMTAHWAWPNRSRDRSRPMRVGGLNRQYYTTDVVRRC